MLSFVILRFVDIFKNNARCLSILQFSMFNNLLIISGISILLELLSIGFRSISLGFRIFANMAAGHVLNDLLSTLKYIHYNNNLFFLLKLTHNTIFLIYEIGITLIQIGVYSALVVVYIN